MVLKYYIGKSNKARPIVRTKFIYDVKRDSTKVERPTVGGGDFSFDGKPSRQFNLSNYKKVSKSTYMAYNKNKINSILEKRLN